jgi:hypothetical protein
VVNGVQDTAVTSDTLKVNLCKPGAP